MAKSEARADHACHIGGRSEQQDRVARFARRDGGSHLLVVADGMGGHEGGALAAEAVVEVAERLWVECDGMPRDPRVFLDMLCNRAHHRIRELGARLGAMPMSTVAALFVTPERAWWVHVGDSRVYGVCGGSLLFCTEDHTLVHNLVRTGKLDEAGRNAHPERHKLLRGLGAEGELRPTHGQMRMRPGLGFLLCTDGFWSLVPNEDIVRWITDDESVVPCADRVEQVAAEGGPDADNIAVAVLRNAMSAPQSMLKRTWPLLGALAAAAILLAQKLR